jgi:hypothetical protein
VSCPAAYPYADGGGYLTGGGPVTVDGSYPVTIGATALTTSIPSAAGTQANGWGASWDQSDCHITIYVTCSTGAVKS